MKKRNNDKKARLALLLAFVIALAVCVSPLASCIIGIKTDPNEEKYAEAYTLLEKGEYEAAYEIFTALGDYKDAAKEVSKFRYIFDGYTETYGEPDDMETETAVITYNEDNLPIKCEKTYLDGYVHVCNLEYDENGRLVLYSCDDDNEYYGKHEWTYDENGNMLTYTINYNDGAVYTEERTYDENGNNTKIEAEGYGEYYEEKYEAGYYYTLYDISYDENGNYTNFFAVDGDETIEGEFWYTEDGIMTKSLLTVTYGEQVTLEEEFYDEKGNMTRKTFTRDGEVIESSDYTYDENGNCLGEIYTVNDEDGEYVCTYINTYDENGNCIRRTVEDSDGYTSDRNVTYRLVYIPYEYSEVTWTTMMDNLYYW